MLPDQLLALNDLLRHLIHLDHKIHLLGLGDRLHLQLVVIALALKTLQLLFKLIGHGLGLRELFINGGLKHFNVFHSQIAMVLICKVHCLSMRILFSDMILIHCLYFITKSRTYPLENFQDKVWSEVCALDLR